MEWATSAEGDRCQAELFWEQPVKIMVRQPSSAAAEKTFLNAYGKILRGILLLSYVSGDEK